MRRKSEAGREDHHRSKSAVPEEVLKGFEAVLL
jgi:hypothetical protein